MRGWGDECTCEDKDVRNSTAAVRFRFVHFGISLEVPPRSPPRPSHIVVSATGQEFSTGTPSKAAHLACMTFWGCDEVSRDTPIVVVDRSQRVSGCEHTRRVMYIDHVYPQWAACYGDAGPCSESQSSMAPVPRPIPRWATYVP